MVGTRTRRSLSPSKKFATPPSSTSQSHPKSPSSPSSPRSRSKSPGRKPKTPNQVTVDTTTGTDNGARVLPEDNPIPEALFSNIVAADNDVEQHHNHDADSSSSSSERKRNVIDSFEECWLSCWPRSIDPTVSFVLLTLSIIIGKNLVAANYDPFVIINFFLNIWFIITVIVTYLVHVIATDVNGARHTKFILSKSDAFVSMWYLSNAGFFHVLLDGFSGSFGLIDIIVSQYKVLDNRFVTHDSVPYVVGLIELFLMAPLCYYVYVAIHRNWPSRYPVEIVVSTLQFFGMLMFTLCEIYDDQVNVPASNPVGTKGNLFGGLNFQSQDQFVYYWFGFVFCNLIWGIVPLLRIRASFSQILSHLKRSR